MVNSHIPRRVVTGLRAGKSTITEDSTVENVAEHMPGVFIADIWATDTMPVGLENEIKIENTLIPHTPKNGSYFRYVSIPPDAKIQSHHKTKNVENDIHPHMHKTETLDYIIILSGEIYLILEETETLLKAGDIVIQRATNHAWSNRSTQPCVQLAILLDAKK